MPEGLTIEKLADEMRPYFGHVCMLFRSDLGVLCGVGQDEMDLYYIVRPQGRKPDTWFSAVGHCESLKPHLPEEMYAGIERIFELNGGLPETFEMLLDEGEGVRVAYTPERLDALMVRWRAEHEARIAENLAEG